MSETFKCSHCGGDLKYTPELQNWKCEWCDSEYTEADFKQFAENEKQELEQQKEKVEYEKIDPDTIANYKCTFCGAEVVTEKETVATFCVYCHRPVILGDKVSGYLKPDLMIPFKNTKEAAFKQFKDFLKGKVFLPDAYIQNQNIEKLTGVYIPFWLYSGRVKFHVSGEADKISSHIRGNYKITETDTYRFIRKGSIDINNVPVDASRKTDDDIMDSIEPFDFNELTQFATPYLSGFLAEKYDITTEECFPRMEKRFRGSADNAVSATLLKYSTTRKRYDEKNVSDIKSKYALLPVWLLHSKFDSKDYTFAMNGQTSKIIGNLPIDNKKVIKYALTMFGIGSLIGAVIGTILQII